MGNGVPKWIKDQKYHFCAACGSTEDLQYNHLVPQSMGGETEPNNIIVLCAPCHQKWHMMNGRERHNYLVKNGIEKYRSTGQRWGKPPADYENVMRLIAERSTQFNDGGEMHTEAEIMEAAGVKNVCYHKCKRMLLDALKADEWPYSWPKPVQVRNHPVYDHVIKKMRGDVL